MKARIIKGLTKPKPKPKKTKQGITAHKIAQMEFKMAHDQKRLKETADYHQRADQMLDELARISAPKISGR